MYLVGSDSSEGSGASSVRTGLNTYMDKDQGCTDRQRKRVKRKAQKKMSPLSGQNLGGRHAPLCINNMYYIGRGGYLTPKCSQSCVPPLATTRFGYEWWGPP